MMSTPVSISRQHRTTYHVCEAWETTIAKSIVALGMLKLFGVQLFDQAIQTCSQRQLLVRNRRLRDVQFLQCG